MRERWLSNEVSTLQGLTDWTVAMVTAGFSHGGLSDIREEQVGKPLDMRSAVQKENSESPMGRKLSLGPWAWISSHERPCREKGRPRPSRGKLPTVSGHAEMARSAKEVEEQPER